LGVRHVHVHDETIQTPIEIRAGRTTTGQKITIEKCASWESNILMTALLEKAFDRVSALPAKRQNALAHLRVHDEYGKEVFYLRACWRTPVILPDGTSKAATEVTLGPGMSDQLNSIWKFPEEERAWGLNNDVIAAAPATWHDPRRSLAPGRYRLQVKVQGRVHEENTRPVTRDFHFTNLGSGTSLALGWTPQSSDNAGGTSSQPAIRWVPANDVVPGEMSLREAIDRWPDVAAAFLPTVLPRRLTRVPRSDLSAFVARVREERRELTNRGRSEEAQLWSLSATALDAEGWRRRIGNWERDVVAFEKEWDWGEADALAALIESGESTIDPTTVPRPEWRARLIGRIEAGLAWLANHDVPS